MTKTFVTGKGKTIEIGQQLGCGGEGTVYDVPTYHLLAAKLYNDRHQPEASKQAKLRFMASAVDVELQSYSAWPLDTLHKAPNGPVIGFLMPKVSGRAEIHKLYSPGHRKQDYPQAAWNFLVFAARNTAAAFDAIHRHGHVLGDVNQKNVLIGADSKVVLIDTDSFQVNTNGSVHLCKVGVPEFTPPELQGSASFDRVLRTSNHDNFGLALLIFHLLFGGRHPYAGVALRANIGEILEKDIQAFRYAYARDGVQRGIQPPPISIPITIVPDTLQAMFNLAFTESGAKTVRPTAQQWVSALDVLRGQLKRCPSTSMHVYSNHLKRCPWCSLEEGPSGHTYFLDIRVGVASTGASGFDLARVWGTIESILPPPAMTIPNFAIIAVTPNPLPPGIERQGTTIFWRIVIVVATLWLMTVIPWALFFVLVGACIAWAHTGDFGKDELKAEQVKRQAARDAAQQIYDHIFRQVRQVINMEEFTKKKQFLAYLRDEYQQLPGREKIEFANLQKTAESRQKRQFLERQFIDTANISGVGPTKKAALRSFGIETAADVTWDRVIAVKGFGEVLTRAVVDWQKTCERRFVFNPTMAVTEVDKNTIRAQIATRRRTIESALNAGVADLQKIRQENINKANILMPQLQVAGQKLAQAQADLNVIVLHS
jgi:DNA-binding helix-hairpin-helix protein with protein kinase domain